MTTQSEGEMAIKVLRLDDWSVKAALRHEALKGKKCIARGAFSAVYESGKPNTVLKVSVDNLGYWMLNCCAVGVSHWHFPRVIENHGCIGDMKIGGVDFPIYLVEMERLEKLKVGSDARKVARLLSKQQVHSTMKCVSRHGDVSSTSTVDAISDILNSKVGLPRSVGNALKQLRDFCMSYDGARLDMHLGNFMQRKNGELVITDPLMDSVAFEARTRQIMRRSEYPAW